MRKHKEKRMRLASILTLPIHPKLKELIGAAADDHQLPMNEWVSQVLAKRLGHPELAAVPRKPFGRPRKELAAAR